MEQSLKTWLQFSIVCIAQYHLTIQLAKLIKIHYRGVSVFVVGSL